MHPPKEDFVTNHDDATWEIIADVFGEVNRSLKDNDERKGWEYFWYSRIIGPFWWW